MSHEEGKAASAGASPEPGGHPSAGTDGDEAFVFESDMEKDPVDGLEVPVMRKQREYPFIHCPKH